MGEWVKAGPIEVYLPEPGSDELRDGHRDTAVAFTIHKRKPIQMWDDGERLNARLVTALPCSPEEWAEFVDAVKAGKFDLP